jgi:lysozyme
MRKKVAAVAAAFGLIMAFEGLRLHAYRDIVGIPTICFGETRGVKMGDFKTKEECKALLHPRVLEFEKEMRACLRNPDAIPDQPYAASLSLAYNIGSRAFCRSTVARKLNEGKIKQACDAFLLFNKAGGQVSKGLVKRREAERAYCLKGAI